MAEVSQTATITTHGGDAGAAAVGDGSAAYVFQAPPRPVDTGPRRKYRDPAEAPKRPNLMQDRRVVRGNTYAALIPTMAQRKMMETQLNAADARRTARLRTAKSRDVVSGPQDPAAVEGREHRNVQTDDFLEELADKVFEADVSTQTDSIDDRPPPPVFVPKPRGVDKFTKIEEGELFDFDLSVQPILEVLVGKTLDQGLQEVLEEEELKRLEYTRWGFEQKRDQLIAEAQRLEEATRRRYEEKERRMVQERARVVQERVVAQKLAAQTAARGYLAGLHTSVLEQLGKSGTFFDPVVKQVETEFLPWLITKVVHEMEQVDACQAEVDAIVTKAVQGLIKQRDDKIAADRLAAELEAKRLQDEADARAAAAAELARKQAEERAAQQARDEELKRQLEELKAKEQAEAEAEAEEGDEGDDDEEPAPRPGRSRPPVSNGTPLSSVPDDEV